MSSGLKPFFSYFGCKWNLSRHYPKPTFHTIIEPFAGAAGYATRYPDNDVVLYDLNPQIVCLWNYLINTPKSDILSLPLKFDNTNDLDIPDGAKNLLGFWISRSRATPARTFSAWARSGKYITSFWSEDKRRRVAEQCECIRHWKCYLRDYQEVPNAIGTWFVDPPYESEGHHYRFGEIDYAHLGLWCQQRWGQTIVTENSSASWLPFTPFREIRGTASAGKKYTQEVVWTT